MDANSGVTRVTSLFDQQPKKSPWKDVLLLSYQSLGVVYGDLSTSPLYVYKTTFSGKLSLHEDDEEVLGVLSFIFWTLTLIPLFKYIFIVLSADDNGEGTDPAWFFFIKNGFTSLQASST